MSSSIQVYSFSRCGTCKKAISWLDQHQISYELIDIVENPPGKEILRNALNQLENRKLLFNTSGLSYRALGAVAVKAMSEIEAIDALASDGKLIKRPFLVDNKGRVLVGFKLDQWEDALLN